MPGLWGLASSAPSAHAPLLFAAIGGRIQRGDACAFDTYRSASEDPAAPWIGLGRASLGVVDPAPQPATNADGTIVGMLAGELYEVESIRGELARRGRRFRGTSHAEIFLNGYEAEGEVFLRRLHGRFIGAIWDEASSELLLTCDRFGTMPVYYARSEGRLAFATSIVALLADGGLPRASNLRGIAEFLTFGQLLNDDTFYESISALPAAGLLRYSPRDGRLTLERYARLGGRSSGRPIVRGDALGRFADTFQAAVARRVQGPGRLGISLSGGLDSRSILAAIDTNRSPVKAVALGMPGSIDVRAAERLSEMKGCPFRSVPLDGNFLGRFADHLARMVELTDGHYLCQCIVMPTLPIYRELGIDVLLRGHAGELLHMDKAYNYSLDDDAMRIDDEPGLVSWLWRRLRSFMLDAVGRPLFLGGLQHEIEGLAREALRDSVADSSHVDPPPQRIWHHFLAQRLRRETALSLVEFGSVVETRLPYLDNDLVDLVFETAPELKRGEAIQAEILRRLEPRFLDVANANTGARVGAGRLARRASRLRLRILAKLGVSGFQPYERLGLWLRRDLRPLVEDLLLSDRCSDGNLFDPSSLRAIVAEHVEGRRNHTYLILALMILEQGRRVVSEPCGVAPVPGSAGGPAVVLASTP